MDDAHFLEQLLAAENEKELKRLLKRHGPLGVEFFQLLKDRVRKIVEENSQEALRISEIGLEAAEFSREQEGVAYAWWARGNALLFLGRHDDCLAAYSSACSIFAGLGKTEQIAQLQINHMPPLMWTGRYAEAQTMGRSALDALGNQGDTIYVASTLLNLGVCAVHQGNHVEALKHSEQAAGVFTRLGDVVQVARCRVTQAWALECLDRFGEAEALLRNVLEIFADHGTWVPWARTSLNLGVLRARLADHQAALHWLEDSRREFLKAGIEMDAGVADLYRTQCFLDVGLLPEAATLAEQLVDTFARLKMPRQLARAASLLAEVYSHRGETASAYQELGRARTIFRTEGDALEIALIDRQRAALLRDMGRPGEALGLASESAGTLDVQRYPVRHAEAQLVVARCCEDLGRIEEAQVAYQVAWTAGSLPYGTTEPPPVLAYHIAHARGSIAEAAGERLLARGEYNRAVDYLTTSARGLGLDELRGGYLEDKRIVYESALRLALEDGRVADAFRYSELARAGTLRDVLAGGHLAPPKLAENQTAVEELRARWAWRVSALRQPVDLLAEAEEEVMLPASRSTLLRELADLEQELANAYRRLRLADPRFAVMEQGEVLELDKVRQFLPDGTALLSFDHVKDHLMAFVVTGERVDVVPLGQLAELRWEAASLGHALEEVRLFDDPTDLVMLEGELLVNLQVLYRNVFAEPLAQLGSDIVRLFIVPCDVLNTIPLEALHDGCQHLLERYEVCHLPSASLLAVLPISSEVSLGVSLVMGHSWEGRLPLVLDEARGVAEALADSSGREPLLLTEEQATAKALYEQAASAKLVHVAAHGAFRRHAPLFSSLYLADGPLTVNEVYGLDLGQTALATLSGCQTGLGQGHGGEMLGLTHAFFFAGVSTLVVSRWRVDDEATAKLMQDFYAALARGDTVAGALRTAQLSVCARRPHAGYWAAFAAWGRGFDRVFAPVAEK
jgi:tetratricopeptide (TPR) repeat protein